ncbi:hypothetical protein HY214_02000 [Candidatus Roizmanbacteria bacterium]|nr:hypothetical protein [Candidatus Roizmanbacteria bacterium]
MRYTKKIVLTVLNSMKALLDPAIEDDPYRANEREISYSRMKKSRFWSLKSMRSL